jgi:hypothetical protein
MLLLERQLGEGGNREYLMELVERIEALFAQKHAIAKAIAARAPSSKGFRSGGGSCSATEKPTTTYTVYYE